MLQTSEQTSDSWAGSRTECRLWECSLWKGVCSLVPSCTTECHQDGDKLMIDQSQITILYIYKSTQIKKRCMNAAKLVNLYIYIHLICVCFDYIYTIYCVMYCFCGSDKVPQKKGEPTLSIYCGTLCPIRKIKFPKCSTCWVWAPPFFFFFLRLG